jgi:hypothetical protein
VGQNPRRFKQAGPRITREQWEFEQTQHEEFRNTGHRTPYLQTFPYLQTPEPSLQENKHLNP